MRGHLSVPWHRQSSRNEGRGCALSAFRLGRQSRGRRIRGAGARRIRGYATRSSRARGVVFEWNWSGWAPTITSFSPAPSAVTSGRSSSHRARTGTDRTARSGPAQSAVPRCLWGRSRPWGRSRRPDRRRTRDRPGRPARRRETIAAAGAPPPGFWREPAQSRPASRLRRRPGLSRGIRRARPDGGITRVAGGSGPAGCGGTPLQPSPHRHPTARNRAEAARSGVHPARSRPTP